MSAREGLDVVVRIPIGIVNDDGVGGGQIDAETTGASRQKEDEVLRSEETGLTNLKHNTCRMKFHCFLSMQKVNIKNNLFVVPSTIHSMTYPSALNLSIDS